MIPKWLVCVTALAFSIPVWPADPVRARQSFDEDWKFHRGEVHGGEKADLDETGWRRLDLPHDWSIEGPYSAANASGTGFLPGGIGWYRKTFTLPESLRGRRIVVEFDGVYRDSDVWINGAHLGRRPYGYSSFAYELTPWIHFGDKPNLLAVRADHSVVADSRWYTGSGIYRHVRLTITHPVHVARWGTYVRTPVVRDDEALVSVETNVVNASKAAARVRLVTVVEDAFGREAARLEDEELIPPGRSYTFAQQGPVRKPMLWSLENPYLYTAVTRVYTDGKLSDEDRTPFGIRTIRFSAGAGFFLNGKPVKFKGVCIHHDLGALGAAFFEAALERRLKLLKELGVNAIRGSHNPMSPEFYDLCDRLGLLVMDEAFDEWTEGKRKWAEGWNVGTAGTRGYHEAFEEWASRDLEELVLRNRNHPSVVLWSIGNEIEYPGDPFTHPFSGGAKPGTPSANILPFVARRLIATIKRLDSTRPVTQALADIDSSNATGLASMLDVTGYNYQEQHYERDHKLYPERVILGTENRHPAPLWRMVAENPYVLGQFLWTGTDYLGEARRYPYRGSTQGLLDYCGFRKPDSYEREALWSGRPMAYAAVLEPGSQPGVAGQADPATRGRRLAEHWNWSGFPQKSLKVYVYTNCTSAELLLNGRSLGEKKVEDRYSLALLWDVPNEPGVVRVIGKQDGVAAARFELATAGEPKRIHLVPDKTILRANGNDLSHIEVRVVDESGRRVHGARQWIEFDVTGAGRLAAVDNSDPSDVSPVQANRRQAYQGRALAIVRSGKQAGQIRIRASAGGLASADLTLTAQ